MPPFRSARLVNQQSTSPRNVQRICLTQPSCRAVSYEAGPDIAKSPDMPNLEVILPHPRSLNWFVTGERRAMHVSGRRGS